MALLNKSFFFKHLELRSILEDKYNLLSMPFSFRFYLCIMHLVPQHGPGFQPRY